MVTLELRVDERTLERIRQAAEASQCSVEELIHRILEGNGQQPERVTNCSV